MVAGELGRRRLLREGLAGDQAFLCQAPGILLDGAWACHTAFERCPDIGTPLMDDPAYLVRLRAGDEAAYRELVRRHHAGFVRLARVFCRAHATAEEVVQDAWIAVLTGLDGYSGEAPLKAWITGIVVNKARTRAMRDGRRRDLAVALLAASAAWVVHGFYDWDFVIPAVTAPVLVMLGILAGQPDPRRRDAELLAAAEAPPVGTFA